MGVRKQKNKAKIKEILAKTKLALCTLCCIEQRAPRLQNQKKYFFTGTRNDLMELDGENCALIFLLRLILQKVQILLSLSIAVSKWAKSEKKYSKTLMSVLLIRTHAMFLCLVGTWLCLKNLLIKATNLQLRMRKVVQVARPKNVAKP